MSHLGRHKGILVVGHRAWWQSAETEEVDQYTWGLVSHACLDLVMSNYEKCQTGQGCDHFVI